MLSPRHIIFTTVEGALSGAGGQSIAAAAEALDEIARRQVPLVLLSRGTRAQLEPLRRKIEHAHPFVTESGGGIFLPDGYFSQRLEGATRAARYFCVPIAKPYTDATAALEGIASEAVATVEGYSQMSAREIARNTGETVRDAEAAKQREFSERFFFAGDTDAALGRFQEIARVQKWNLTGGDPFWEISSGNDEGRAVRYLMDHFRASLHRRLRAVGIGSGPEHLGLLSAVDQALILPASDYEPSRGQEYDPLLTSRLSKVVPCDAPGPVGWNEAVLKLLAGD